MSLPRPSQRSLDIPPFLVMDVLEAAQRLEDAGRDVIHMEVGEPDLPTPECVREAAVKALRDGETTYTHSQGLLPLREAICEDYHLRNGVTVSPDQIIVTSGTSPAFFLVLSALLSTGDEVLMTDPHYACYPNMVSFLGGCPAYVPLEEEAGWQPDPETLARSLTSRTRALLVNSPANPTGGVLSPNLLGRMASLGIPVISDEIYQGLVYGERARSILEFTDRAFVLNGFSKLYAMTGWRLGYVIAPPSFVRPMQKIQQNFFISAAAFIQRGGIAALREGALDVERMVRTYGERRRSLLAGLRRAGFNIPVDPAGAFYVLVNARHLSRDSKALAFEILEKASVAVTPGVDFGARAEGYLRFSYANSLENLAEGVRRLEGFLEEREHGKKR